MTEADGILVRVLAEADAVRLPIRDWKAPTPTNRHTGQQNLAGAGLPFRLNADAEDARKHGEELLLELADSGLIVLTRSNTKFPLVKLTVAGECRARALAGLPGRDVGRMILEAVAARTDRNPATLDRQWCAEIALNGGRGWGQAAPNERRALGRIELDYLAAASEGWLTSNTTHNGHAYFSVTAAGWSELDNPAIRPKCGPMPPTDPDAVSRYRAAQDAALVALSSNKREWAGELGAIALPVTLKGVPAVAL